jgi:CubicO group peptidase (beta-lactamase class C family)
MLLLLLLLLATRAELPFARLKIAKAGKLVYDQTINGPLGTITEDSLYRYYSQTKIIATVTTLLAAERGLLRLDDPVEMYIPEFANPQRYVSGTIEGDDIVTEDAESLPTIRQCLMHTAGLAYGGLFAANGIVDEVDKLYVANDLGVEDLIHEGGLATVFGSLEKVAARIGTMPLRHHPGHLWDYANGHIVAVRCAEVVMGRTATEIMQTEIFDPLGMANHKWGVDKSDPNLLPMFEYGTVTMEEGKPWSLYQRDPVPATHLDITNSDAVAALQQCVLPDGQGTGTADDWWRMFACLMEGGRSPHTGHRLLSPRATELMMSSQLPGGVQMYEMASSHAELAGMAAPASSAGIGYGLGKETLSPSAPTLIYMYIVVF